MSTLPTPFSPYACLTEFVQASVSASLRSCRASSETGRTPAIAVRARRPSVMYSAFAGMVSRTERPSSLMTGSFPKRVVLTRRNRRGCRRRPRVRILVRLRALAETERQVDAGVPALDCEVGYLTRAEVRDNPRNVLRTDDLLAVDGHDHVAVPREVEPERLSVRGRFAEAGPVGRASLDDARHDGALRDRIAEPMRERGSQVGRLDTDIGVGDRAVGDQLVHRASRGVDRDREADAFRLAARAADLRVDPDHAPPRVE